MAGSRSLNRANTAAGTAVFHSAGSDITLANLVLENAVHRRGRHRRHRADAANDTVQGSANVGVDLEGGDVRSPPSR